MTAPAPTELLKLADEMQSLGYMEFGECLSLDAYNKILLALRQAAAVSKPEVQSDGPITREEMVEMFGSEAPIEAINLIWNAPDHKTLSDIRRELREIAAKQSRTVAQAGRDPATIEACAKIAEPWAGYWLSENSTEADRAVVEVRQDIASTIRALALPSAEGK